MIDALELICSEDYRWWAGAKAVYGSKRKFLEAVCELIDDVSPRDIIPFRIQANPFVKLEWQRPCSDDGCDWGITIDSHWHTRTEGAPEAEGDLLCYTVDLDEVDWYG